MRIVVCVKEVLDPDAVNNYVLSGNLKIYSNAISGYTMRTTRCPWHNEWRSEEAPEVLKPPLQMMLSSDYIQGSLDYQRKDLMTEAAGQGIGYVTEMKPARQILSDIVEEALDVFDGFLGDDD